MDLLFLLFLFGGGYLLYSLWKKGQTNSTKLPAKKRNSNELSIENVAENAVIHLMNIGKDLQEFDVTIKSKHIYRQGDYTWYELEGDNGTDTVWISMEEDDELELAITLKKLKFKDIGITRKKLDKIEQDDDGTITYLDELYYYEDCDDAVFYRHGKEDQAEKFSYWEFENEEGNKFLSVEQWNNGKYDVSYSEKIKLSQLSVYSLGDQ